MDEDKPPDKPRTPEVMPFDIVNPTGDEHWLEGSPKGPGGTPSSPTRLTPEYLHRRARIRIAFLQAYADCGIVSDACRAVKLSRTTVASWLKTDAEFAEAFEQAREVATDGLEKEARRRGQWGVEEPVYYQGQVVGKVQKYSDLLLLALLNAYRADKFKQRHEHTGKDGGPMAVVHVSYDHNMKPDDMP